MEITTHRPRSCAKWATLLVALITLPTSDIISQRLRLKIIDAPTEKVAPFDSLRVVRASDGATWVSTSSTIDLAVSVDEELHHHATVVVREGRVLVDVPGETPIVRVTSTDGRTMETMVPPPGVYCVSVRSSKGVSFHVVNTSIDGGVAISSFDPLKRSSVMAMETFYVTVYRGMFTTDPIVVTADVSSSARVPVPIPRPQWIERVRAIRLDSEDSHSLWEYTSTTPIYRGRARHGWMSHVWSMKEDSDSYSLLGSESLDGVAAFTNSNPDLSADWKFYLYYSPFGARATVLEFEADGSPIVVGNEIHFDATNTYDLSETLVDFMNGGHNRRGLLNTTVVFVLE